MTIVPLFCIAEEAKPSIRKVLNLPQHQFFLAESQGCPSDRTKAKTKLTGDDFSTTFIGASKQDCQQWLLKWQEEAMFIEPNLIAIADARTAKDGTVLMQWWGEGDGEEMKPFGPLPARANTWHNFRIDPREATRVIVALNYVEPDVIYPTYFGHKDTLTDENGVFNTMKADLMIRGEGTKDA